MRRDDVLAVLAAHREEFQRLGVLKLAVFGPVARDEATPDCEIDVLVEVRRPMGFAFFGIQRRLEQLLDHKVNLVTPDALEPALREDIMREAVRAA